MHLLESYENQLAESRVRFTDLIKQLVQSADANNLGFFLIYHSALGVGMTKSVEAWIREAGKRCQKLQYSTLGDALIAHAKHEATIASDAPYGQLVIEIWSKRVGQLWKLMAIICKTVFRWHNKMWKNILNSELL